MRTFWRVECSISFGSRPTAAQCSARIAYLRAMPSGDPKTLQASAYWATSRSVFFSPPPPIMIGTLGRDSDCGELSSRLASNRSGRGTPPRTPRSPSHIPWAIWSVSSSISKRTPRGGNGKPSAARLLLVPGGADAEPGPAARQDVERRGGLDPQPRVPVVDAADHQAEAGASGVRGHEAERGPALEHRLLDLADAPDLEEMVHHPDRIEADVVGVADDLGECRGDRLGAAGPRERVDLEAELHFVAERTSIPFRAGSSPMVLPLRCRRATKPTDSIGDLTGRSVEIRTSYGVNALVPSAVQRAGTMHAHSTTCPGLLGQSEASSYRDSASGGNGGTDVIIGDLSRSCRGPGRALCSSGPRFLCCRWRSSTPPRRLRRAPWRPTRSNATRSRSSRPTSTATNNENHYASKPEVYLNGGPGPSARLAARRDARLLPGRGAGRHAPERDPQTVARCRRQVLRPARAVRHDDATTATSTASPPASSTTSTKGECTKNDNFKVDGPGSLKITKTVEGGQADFSGSFPFTVDCGIAGDFAGSIVYPGPGSQLRGRCSRRVHGHRRHPSRAARWLHLG